MSVPLYGGELPNLQFPPNESAIGLDGSAAPSRKKKSVRSTLNQYELLAGLRAAPSNTTWRHIVQCRSNLLLNISVRIWSKCVVRIVAQCTCATFVRVPLTELVSFQCLGVSITQSSICGRFTFDCDWCACCFQCIYPPVIHFSASIGSFLAHLFLSLFRP